jgi:hypothetical protein
VSPVHWTRRTFVAALVFVTGSLAAPWLPRRTSRDAAARERARRLVAVVPAPHSAARIGAHYLAVAPDERDLDLLVRLLDTAEAADRMSTGALRTRLLAMQRDDFALERVVELDGWLLSRTEVRLYALATLLGA